MLLQYVLSTAPQPLGTSNTGVINVHVRQGGQPAWCNEVILAVKVGDDTDCLFQAAPMPTCAVNTGRWAMTSATRVDAREVGQEAGDWAQFIFNCRSQTDYDLTYNLVFSLRGVVGESSGQFAVMVQERSGSTSDPNRFTRKSGSCFLSAALPAFYLNNLVATATGSPTVPRTEFGNGQDITLSWESNGTWFQLFKKGETAPFWAGGQTTVTLRGGVATDTTFFLVATRTGDPSQDHPQAGFTLVTLYDAITLITTHPDLTPRTVQTSGALTVGGDLTVTGAARLQGQAHLSSASVDGNLTVSGASTLRNTSLDGTLGVSGNTTLASTLIKQGLTAHGGTTLNGGVTVNGGLSASGGTVSLFTGARGVGVGTYSASTDGFVLGVVSWPGNLNELSLCIISGGTEGIRVSATGGNVGLFDTHWNKWASPNGNSFMFPVLKGTSWWVGANQMQRNQVPAPYSFTFIPVGRPPSGEVLTKVSDTVPDHPLSRTTFASRSPKSKAPDVDEFVRIISLLTDKPIPPELRDRLVGVLTRLSSEEHEESTDGKDR